MGDNTIFDSNNDNVYGLYNDLVKAYKKIIKEQLDDGDLESVESYTEDLKEIERFKDYDGLLVLSENNGMGFTCDKYRDDWEIAKWVAENIAPEDDDAMPKIFGDYDRQKAFMEEVKRFMKGDC